MLIFGEIIENKGFSADVTQGLAGEAFLTAASGLVHLGLAS
jgi:hypothetical protein